MNSNMDHVLNAALALPDGDRVELVEAIIASLQPEDRPPFDESWREVISRRSAELRSGQATVIPWQEVKARARGTSGG
jgi:putative addiction module component (TIGR02574 family)